jgi:hypothetical protein
MKNDRGLNFLTNVAEKGEQEEIVDENTIPIDIDCDQMVASVCHGLDRSQETIVEQLRSEMEEEDVEIPNEIVVAASPKTAVDRMEQTATPMVSKAVTQVVVEEKIEAIVEAPVVVEESIVAESIQEAIVIEEMITLEAISEEQIALANEVMITPEIIEDTQIEEGIVNPVVSDPMQGNWGPDSPLFSSSGLTVEQIGKVLDGTEMYGLEQCVYDTEQKYGINACILLAIACNESGYGASRMAHRQNNLFGMMGMKFSSLEENIDYFGQLMVKYRDTWHKTMTANGICRAYVGQNENTAGWPKKITGIMNQIYDKATR